MSHQPIHIENITIDGKPAGGTVAGVGLTITWQNGPLREQGSDEPAAPNGAFVEDVLLACKARLDFYQQSGYACDENTAAIQCIAAAVQVLDARTARRIAAGTEGTHRGN